MNTFTKTEVFLSVFVQKRSIVNGALVNGLKDPFQYSGSNFPFPNSLCSYAIMKDLFSALRSRC